ncbi:hypothetical protein ABZ319_10035 [Nocardia sp. NPDC005978]
MTVGALGFKVNWTPTVRGDRTIVATFNKGLDEPVADFVRVTVR